MSTPLAAAADLDMDGVSDNADRCLYSPPRVRVDARGCSSQADQDGDRIVDEADDCPYSPRGSQVDARGCATDEDLDGIANGLDFCARSAPGQKVDGRGCAAGQSAARSAAVSAPVPAGAAVSGKAQQSFLFEPRSVGLDKTAQAQVRALVPKLRQGLATDSAQRLEIRGYADAASDGERAPVLARARALKLQELLQAQGIDPQKMRILAQWPGPVSARRVDLVLVPR